MTHIQFNEKVKKRFVLKCRMFSFGGLDVLHEGMRILKNAMFHQKIMKLFR
jgi:hypothetical protein